MEQKQEDEAVVEKIEQDYRRFRDIVRGVVRKELKKYVTHSSLVGKKGREKVSIPVPQIELPRFVHSRGDGEGVGQGEGDVGDTIGQGGQEGQGAGQAGDQPGEHSLEVEVTLEELADILGEELELPRIQPKGERATVARRMKYNTISKVGPDSLRHFKRTYRKALLRQISSGEYNPADPIVTPRREDLRYRSFTIDVEPKNNAVIFYMMDVSGSMGDEQKEIVRVASFWLDTWIRRHYQGIESRYIVHDATAREVDEETFFHTKESGGTLISTAYELCANLQAKDYPTTDWNIYAFHFSDGDNWSTNDNDKCIELLRTRLLPNVNLFGYGQVQSPYGSGQFMQVLEKEVPGQDNVVLAPIADRDAIIGAIKVFLHTGR
jgi:uncharacterized sporulation protein YeaH/YhbH (DUF444 family)